MSPGILLICENDFAYCNILPWVLLFMKCKFKEWRIALAFPKPRADFCDSQTKHAPGAKTLLFPPIERLDYSE